MLVRWQYWDASVKMFLDNHIIGVGGGNFSSYYPQYKTPSAPETVSDPHCFVLSILTQYGPLALLGFLIIILVPLWRNSLDDNINLKTTQARNFINLATLCAIVTATCPNRSSPVHIASYRCAEPLMKKYTSCFPFTLPPPLLLP